MIKDKAILKQSKKLGIDSKRYYHWKLYNPASYDRFIEQAIISQKTAVKVYGKLFNKRVK